MSGGRDLMKRALVGVSMAALLSAVAVGQSTDAKPAFTLADVHVSPRSTTAAMRVLSRAGRYEIRNATMVDLIRTGYTVDAENVLGGPSWLEYRPIRRRRPRASEHDARHSEADASGAAGRSFQAGCSPRHKAGRGARPRHGQGQAQTEGGRRLHGSRLPGSACSCAAAGFERSGTVRAADDRPRLPRRHDGEVCG